MLFVTISIALPLGVFIPFYLINGIACIFITSGFTQSITDAKAGEDNG